MAFDVCRSPGIKRADLEMHILLYIIVSNLCAQSIMYQTVVGRLGTKQYYTYYIDARNHVQDYNIVKRVYIYYIYIIM